MFNPLSIAGALLATILVVPTPERVPGFDSSPLDAATIPVLAPTVVPSDYGTIALTPLSGRPYSDEGGYVIVVGARKDCAGGAACEYASLEGGPDDVSTPSRDFGRFGCSMGRRDISRKRAAPRIAADHSSCCFSGPAPRTRFLLRPANSRTGS